jgi:hypothetical protein
MKKSIIKFSKDETLEKFLEDCRAVLDYKARSPVNDALDYCSWYIKGKEQNLKVPENNFMTDYGTLLASSGRELHKLGDEPSQEQYDELLGDIADNLSSIRYSHIWRFWEVSPVTVWKMTGVDPNEVVKAAPYLPVKDIAEVVEPTIELIKEIPPITYAVDVPPPTQAPQEAIKKPTCPALNADLIPEKFSIPGSPECTMNLQEAFYAVSRTF